jgi:hypothetical protein
MSEQDCFDLDIARNDTRALLDDGASISDAIRQIRERHGLSLIQAKEIHIQAVGIAANLHDYQQQLIDALNADPADINDSLEP